MIEIKRKDGSVIKTIDADSLRGADLSEADLREANLGEANLSEADLRGADLGEANLRWADLQGADLQGANLGEAGLRWADLQGANLGEANLQGANLRGADMQDANLRDADLRWANLQWANLRGCKQYVVVIHASRDSIVGIDDDIRIGCKRMTLAEWLRRFEALGREAGYTEQQIAEYGIYLKAIRDVLEVRKNAATNE